MPVTVVLPHKPLPLPDRKRLAPVTDAAQIISGASRVHSKNQVDVWAGSWHRLRVKDGIHSSADSFVRGAYEAWARHMHFAIRPDEVWFAILAQLCLYMGNKENAENLRHLFVDHEGKEEIFIEDRPPVNLPGLISRFSGAIQKRVKTPWLEDWIMPRFSTTSPEDRLTATIMMMGITASYFAYGMGITCGIPSVTLLGEREDWELLVDKLGRLPEFGREPTEYAAKLYHILSWFPRTFDEPDSDAVRGFWNRIVSSEPDRVCGHPPATLEGWILDFVYWGAGGTRLSYVNLDNLPVGYSEVGIIWKQAAGDGIPLRAFAGGLAKLIRPGAPLGYVKETHSSAAETSSTVKKRPLEHVEQGDGAPSKKNAIADSGSWPRLPDLNFGEDFHVPYGLPEDLAETTDGPAPPTSDRQPYILRLDDNRQQQWQGFLDKEILGVNLDDKLSLYHGWYGAGRSDRKDAFLVYLDTAQARWASEQDLVVSCEPLLSKLSSTPSVGGDERRKQAPARGQKICPIDADTVKEHATLQPLSGWVLFRDNGQPFRPYGELDDHEKLGLLLGYDCKASPTRAGRRMMIYEEPDTVM
ncbi:hypothetical protein MFIFM68171_00648 [Madurella fahalii]|uniref:Uncharacterized protein n=1 Tax=Madurella fahalii TaxID=1157608 RepID=A0ABQ0FY80_9PEZI